MKGNNVLIQEPIMVSSVPESRQCGQSLVQNKNWSAIPLYNSPAICYYHMRKGM